LGSGKVIYQAKTRIDQSISNNTFLTNQSLLEVINHVKQNNSTLHLLGMLSSSSTLSSLNHLISLIYMAKSNGVNNICLHLIADGKDGPKYEMIELIQKLNQEYSRLGAIKIGSISGRFYALNDHDEMYLEKYCNFLLSSDSINFSKDLFDQLLLLREKSITDEFIEPFAIKDNFKPIANNDGLILLNLKPNAFPMEFLIQKLNTNVSGLTNLKISSLVDMKKDLNVRAAFPNEKVEYSLAMILSQNKKRQAHLTESLKSLHITYYFNGLNQKPFEGEY